MDLLHQSVQRGLIDLAETALVEVESDVRACHPRVIHGFVQSRNRRGIDRNRGLISLDGRLILLSKLIGPVSGGVCLLGDRSNFGHLGVSGP